MKLLISSVNYRGAFHLHLFSSLAHHGDVGEDVHGIGVEALAEALVGGSVLQGGALKQFIDAGDAGVAVLVEKAQPLHDAAHGAGVGLGKVDKSHFLAHLRIHVLAVATLPTVVSDVHDLLVDLAPFLGRGSRNGEGEDEELHVDGLVVILLADATRD